MSTSSWWLCIIPVLNWTPIAYADYKSDIGYSGLEALLNSNVPTGFGVNVIQVEAPQGVDGAKKPIAAPDTSQFSGKTFDLKGSMSPTASDHATGVGTLFYGNNSMAFDIQNITAYDAVGWLNAQATTSVLPPVNSSRIANHSWVGGSATNTAGTDVTGQILRLVDRQSQRNELIQIAGMANGTSYNPMLGSAYNVVAVGRTDGGHDRGSDAVVNDQFYGAGRVRPDLVAPTGYTSSAAPMVSAAAALLVETGHNGGLALSNGSSNISNTLIVYNAERSETVKAALMAGADRATQNASTTANISDYRATGHQTGNGLDDRFGAGQLNVLHSYQIIAAGEQNSLEDGGANLGTIEQSGFDYDEEFGGAGSSNDQATYKFTAQTNVNLSASLVWNLGVSDDSSLTTILHDLNLELFDATEGTVTAFSESTIDNTENLWIDLVMGHHYELRVKAGGANKFNWDYALAWHMTPVQTTPVPLPAAIYLFASAIAGFGSIGRRKG